MTTTITISHPNNSKSFFSVNSEGIEIEKHVSKHWNFKLKKDTIRSVRYHARKDGNSAKGNTMKEAINQLRKKLAK